MISTGTLQDPGLVPVLAHELGHLNTMDGYLSVALNRIAAPATLWYRAADGLGDGWFAILFVYTGWICSGAAALRIVRPLGRLVPRPRIQSRPIRRQARSSH
jgi:Zn-dependent protease with chaperone function